MPAVKGHGTVARPHILKGSVYKLFSFQSMGNAIMGGIQTDKTVEHGTIRLGKEAAGLKHAQDALYDCHQELETINRYLEEVLERYNDLAVEAELAAIEIKQIFNTSADGMWVIDENFDVQRINEALLMFLGNHKDEVIGKKCYDLFSTSICRTPNCPLNRLQNGENRVECDIETICPDGLKKSFILSATPFQGVAGEMIGIVVGLKDNTERKKAEMELQKANQELERIATIDGLTQIANRRQFDKCLTQEWKRMRREQTPLSLILCDIDFFKLYNDAYGHQMGDECIRTVAQAIRRSVKRPADLAARYGGEEFAVILPNTNAEGAVLLAENIRKAVQHLKIIHARSPVSGYVSLSLGVASIIPFQEFAPETLIEMADKALYEAKKHGRNRVILKTMNM